MLFWAGLRGAMSLALSSQLELAHEKSSKIIRGTTLIVVVITVILMGGTTQLALEKLQIETGIPEVEEDEIDSEYNAVLKMLDQNLDLEESVT
jgi:NhaP-type Na+/H+ or K+/H+ antiporter